MRKRKRKRTYGCGQAQQKPRMGTLQTVNFRAELSWKTSVLPCKTLTLKPLKRPTLFPPPSFSRRRSTPLSLQSRHNPSSSAAAAPQEPIRAAQETGPLAVESYYQNQRLWSLIEQLTKKGSNALQILREYGDWRKDQFWAVVTFLLQESRPKEVLQVFDQWKNMEVLRISEYNYDKIIRVLSEEGHMEEVVCALGGMKKNSLCPSLETYNLIIHGFARKGKFDNAFIYLNEMKDTNIKPDTGTYDGLIEAYGKFKMYDEMGLCVKMMELDGCSPDHITYNLLMREYSKAGLLKRMEKTYHTLLSKRMRWQSYTLVAVLEAYANFGILDKMENAYRKVLNSKTPLKEDLVRKVAKVYIENHMFSRLDDLGFDLSSCTIESELAWCLRLLSHACLLSRKGMDSVIEKMEAAKIPWNITIANSILLAYLKMKDFTHFKILLSELPSRCKPDIVSLGILFDAERMGYNGIGAVYSWRRMGLFNEAVEMDTDPLVISAFGKGHFLRSCEDVYCSLGAKDRERKKWTYQMLINLVSKSNDRQSSTN